ERHQALLAAAADVPASAVPPLTSALVERNDPVLLPFAFAALAARPGRKLDDAALKGALSLVEKSTVPQLRLLGMRMLQTAEASGGPGAAGMLNEAMVRLAASERPGDALFAVRQAANLDSKTRAVVLDGAAKQASAEIQRLVRLSQ